MTHALPPVFSTGDLCDAHKNDSSGRFRVLPPIFKSFGGVPKFCGLVVTVKCFEDNSFVKAAVDGSGSLRAAGRQLGRSSSEKQLGWHGDRRLRARCG